MTAELGAELSALDGVEGRLLAYVFERFPSFTQTFCAREVSELAAQGMRPAVFSIRTAEGEPEQRWGEEFDANLLAETVNLPPSELLRDLVMGWKQAGELSQAAVLLLRHWGKRGDKNRLLEAIWLERALRDTGITHVHTHFAGIGARTCWWLRQLSGMSYSLTAHANDLFCAPEEVLSLGRVLEDAALVVTVSDFTANWIRQHYPQVTQLKRIYNGLNLSPFEQQAAEAGNTQEPVKICSVGRLIEKKGFGDLIGACAKLKQRGIGFHCVIAGEGELEEALRGQIAQLNLGAQVQLAGAMNQAQVRVLLQRSQIFALPCVVEADGGMDNLPTVIAEAMAAKLPVVSTKLAGVPEMVDHGKTGLLVEPGAVGALAGAITQLIFDPQLRELMGAQGQKRAQAMFARVDTVRELRHALVKAGAVQPALSRPLWRADLWRPWWKGVWQRLRNQQSLGGDVLPWKSVRSGGKASAEGEKAWVSERLDGLAGRDSE